MPSLIVALLLLLVAGMPAHAQTYDYSEADGLVSAPAGTQILITHIPRSGNVCANCIIKGWDGGFAKIRFFHAMPSASRQEFRLVAEMKMDPLRTVRAPNGEGGEEFVSLSELGINQVRRAEAVVVMEVTNPSTGEVRTGTQTFQVESGVRTLLNGSVTVGGGWRIARTSDSLRTAPVINSHYKFRVRSVTWSNATFPFITQVDSRVRARLKARERAAETQQQASSTAPSSSGTSGSQIASGVTSSPATASSGSGGGTNATGATPATPRQSSNGVYRDQATEERERAARESMVNSIESGRRQAEKDRAARQAEADRIVAAAVPAVMAAGSLIGDLMPQTTFGLGGIGGFYGTNGKAAYFDGGPGWRLTPRGAPFHFAISPGFFFGWNEPRVKKFAFLYKETGEDTASLKPAKVSGDLILGIGGNIFFDSPWKKTSGVISVYKTWGGSDVSPGYSSDVATPTSLIFRGELLRGLGFGDGAIALGGGYHKHTLHYSSRTNSGTREHSRASNGFFASLRYVTVELF